MDVFHLSGIKNGLLSCSWREKAMILKRLCLFLTIIGCLATSAMAQSRYESQPPGRCTTIALTPDDRHLVVVNRQNDSASIIEVVDRNGNDTSHLIAEISVGREPRYVAVSPDGKAAFITNAVDGTVVVIDLSADHPAIVGDPIHVG
ncbi:MAG: YncE family protein, partial [Candidatus Tectomicrobia bacterium]|nr:YncE family protein [Candidatus Tectomicrobia bacterium]